MIGTGMKSIIRKKKKTKTKTLRQPKRRPIVWKYNKKLKEKKKKKKKIESSQINQKWKAAKPHSLNLMSQTTPSQPLNQTEPNHSQNEPSVGRLVASLILLLDM